MLARVIVIALFLPRLGVSGEEDELAGDPTAASFDEDDECGSDGAQCALNALQRKSISVVASPPGGTPKVHDAAVNGTHSSNASTADVATLNPDAMDLGNGPLGHYAQMCWEQCGGKAGFCTNFCGEDNACCKYPGGGDQPPECGGSYIKWWPVLTWYTCVSSHYGASPAIPAPAPPIIGTNIMTLYQLTSPTAARSIIGSNFRPGSGGWCGGAIYLINTPHLPKSKWNPQTTQDGAYVEAQVEMGRMCRMQRTCNDGASGKCCTYPLTQGHGAVGAQAAGCNSMVWNPGDGDEYIIWHPEQVKSRRLYSCYKPECATVFPGLTFDSAGIVQSNTGSANTASSSSPAPSLPPAPPPPSWWDRMRNWAGWTPAPPPSTL